MDNTVKQMALDGRWRVADGQGVFERKYLQMDRERGMVSTKQNGYSTWLRYRN